MKHVLLVLLSFWLLIKPHIMFSQPIHDKVIYTCYLSGDMKSWYASIQAMKADYEATKESGTLLRLLSAQYGYIGYLLGQEENEKAKVMLGEATRNAENLIRIEPGWSTPHALLGALYGFKIHLNWTNAPIIGPKSIDLIDKALELNPEDPNAWVEKANVYFYSPGAFGGDKTLALVSYSKAVSLFERDKTQIAHNWHYLATLTALANCHQELKQYDKAKAVYQKILTIAPGYKWVKEELYPALLEKM